MTAAHRSLFHRRLLLRPSVDTHAALLPDALRLKARYRLSYWAAAIVATAMQIGAATLYSEDLQDGQEFGGAKIVNPFLSA